MGPKEDLKRSLNGLKEGWQMTYLGSREGSKRGPLRGHVKLGSEGKGLQKGVQKWGQYQGISWHTGHQTMGSLEGPKEDPKGEVLHLFGPKPRVHPKVTELGQIACLKEESQDMISWDTPGSRGIPRKRPYLGPFGDPTGDLKGGS